MTAAKVEDAASQMVFAHAMKTTSDATVLTNPAQETAELTEDAI